MGKTACEGLWLWGLVSYRWWGWHPVYLDRDLTEITSSEKPGRESPGTYGEWRYQDMSVCHGKLQVTGKAILRDRPCVLQMTARKAQAHTPAQNYRMPGASSWFWFGLVWFGPKLLCYLPGLPYLNRKAMSPLCVSNKNSDLLGQQKLSVRRL